MTSASRSLSTPATDNVDRLQMTGVLRRRWLPLLLAPLLVGGATYALSSRQPPLYRSSTSLMATPTDVGGALGQTSITASPLPQGAVEQVLDSRSMMERVEISSLAPEIQRSIATDMQQELASRAYDWIQVRARLDRQQRGTYEIQISAGTPKAARVLAAAASLLAWDLGRVKGSVSLGRQNLQQQLQDLNRRVETTAPGSAERQALETARAQVILGLSQATVLERGARGNLTLLAEADTPNGPVSPRPLRSAALAALITMFGAVGLALLLDALRRKVNSSSDLTQLGLPVLGELSYLSGLKRAQTLLAGNAGRHAAEILSNPAFPQLLRQWAQGYGMVILDTPPIRAVADALATARSTDGLALVVENQETPISDVESALHDINTTGVCFLGVILNKVKSGGQRYYSYAYAAAD